MFPLFLVVILCVVGHCTGSERYFNALHFGTSSNDYVSFNYDMSAFQESLSVCAWIKRIYTSSSQPTVLNYYPGSKSHREILITATGSETYVLNDGDLSNYRSRFTTPTGRWFHLCMTWAKSTTTSKLYLDGVLVGTGSTPSRSLYTGGGLCLGRLHPSWTSHSGYIFGGEVFNLNMFSEVLSDTEIKKAAQEGLCSRRLQDLESRVLKWEYILARSKSGSVFEFDTGCGAFLEMQQNLTSLLNETTVRLEKELEVVSETLNETEHSLNSTQKELQKTEDLLETCSETLADTRSTLSAARKFENVSRWDVLLTEPYFNQVFTEELYEQLTSSWTILGEFITLLIFLSSRNFYSILIDT